MHIGKLPHRWSWFLVIGLLGIVVLTPGFPNSQSAQVESNYKFFPETGHVVEGDFLTFYNSLPDPLRLLGYPITDSIPDPISGRPIQYFQKARLEVIVDVFQDQQRQRVQLTPLGNYIYTPGLQLSRPDQPNGCQVFRHQPGAESGEDFQVCYAFLNFFQSYGGVEYFGNPISNMEFQDGRIVQYFQNARLDWHPEFPPGERVVVSNLGIAYFHLQGTNPIHLRQGNHLPQTILGLKMHAYPTQAITGLNGEQTIYIIVQDQNLLAVPEARVVLKVHFPSGKEAILPADSPTDAHGVTRLTLPFSTTSPGVITVTATTRFNDIKQTAVTSFRTWW